MILNRIRLKLKKENKVVHKVVLYNKRKSDDKTNLKQIQ